jgi:hypothetical protein
MFAALGLLLIVGLVSATVLFTYNQTASILVPFDLYLDGSKTEINSTIAWGTLYPAYTYNKTMTVVNTGNTTINVSCQVSGLTPGWLQTWTANNTLATIGQNVSGLLFLTTPSNATAQDYSWLLTVTATSQ